MAKIDVKEIGALARSPAFGAGTLHEGICLYCTAAGGYTQWCQHKRDFAALAKATGRPAPPPLRFRQS